MSQPPNLLVALISEIETVSIVWQLGIIAACLSGAWLIARALRPRLIQVHADAQAGEDAFRLGTGGLMRVLNPAIGWLLLLVGRWALQFHHPVNLLNIAIPLSSSLVVIRITIYVLRHIFAPGGWLKSSERAIAWTMWVVAVLHITGLLPQIRAWLDELTLPLGAHSISLLNVIEGTLSVAITILLAMWVGRLAESRIMALSHLDVNLRVVFAKTAKAVFLVFSVLIALPLMGIDVTVLSVFGGAVGVGLGFGLQKIAANYVSGFAILLDRSIKLGDLVTIDNRYGEVTRLTARYVVVKGYDGTEAIIPNESVITSTVLNHSYSDRLARIDLGIQVAYSTDLRLALETLQSAALASPRVVPQPAPVAFVKDFGDSGINLELMIWIADPEGGRANLRSELNLRIFEAFQAAGIEIPFPQRDVRIVRDLSLPDTEG
ncbi:MAG: mechanosensitive ion channel domain-containing protein [Betaproteobacteria bacterium]